MLITGAILSSFQSLKDKTLKVVFETQEATPDMLTEIARLNQSFGFLAFKKDDFKQDEREMIQGLESEYQDKGKSKSQRLRAVLFINWKQEDKGYEVFDDYYNFMMEKIITFYKGKLD